jgi:dolichyl-phosphate beta-glucosyltransferase
MLTEHGSREKKDKGHMAFLSIVIPAYNEEGRILPTLNKIGLFLKPKKYDFEIILVDDGSSDNTVLTAERSDLFRGNKLKIVKNGVNRGKGFSVKNGIAHSTGEFILLSDADLSTPIEEIDKLFASMNNGRDIVIGSRSIKESNVMVRQPYYREIMGKTFNFFVKTLLIKDFNDTQCGFKLFKGDIAREIAGHMNIDGFCFDVEMLYLAKIKGYNIKEEGVAWNNSPCSKVRLFHSSINMFFDLAKIRVMHNKKR